ncbi:MAG: hypothetical protein K4571_13760 [Deltaproteobacteria bacterium]
MDLSFSQGLLLSDSGRFVKANFTAAYSRGRQTASCGITDTAADIKAGERPVFPA